MRQEEKDLKVKPTALKIAQDVLLSDINRAITQAGKHIHGMSRVCISVNMTEAVRKAGGSPLQLRQHSDAGQPEVTSTALLRKMQ